MASHRIEFLSPIIVRCLCGWTYRTSTINQELSRHLKENALLDAYNLHKKRPQKASGPGRDEE
jgi:hypothetical protein